MDEEGALNHGAGRRERDAKLVVEEEDRVRREGSAGGGYGRVDRERHQGSAGARADGGEGGGVWREGKRDAEAKQADSLWGKVSSALNRCSTSTYE